MKRLDQKILVILGFLILASLLYFMYKNRNTAIAKLQTSPVPTSIVSNLSKPSPRPSAKSLSLIIEDSINSKDTKTLEGKMSPSVNVAIYASECCGQKPPTEATLEIDKFIENATPFDFNQQSDTVKNLKSKNQGLSDSFVGISNNNKLIAFTLKNDQITKIEMSASYKIYSQ